MIIEEKKGYFGLKYYKYTENKPAQIVNVCVIRKKVNGMLYYTMFSNLGHDYSDFYNYINHKKKYQHHKKRELIATSLKLLYSFVELFNIDINTINEDEISKLIEFLKGENSERFKLTIRSNSTINKYLSVYRDYFKYLNIECEALNEKISVYRERDSNSFLGHTYTNSTTKYASSLKERKSIIKDEVPDYISIKEYRRIMELIDEEYGLREKIIIKLMYEYGLRLGEVLGLTLEDINCIENENGELESGELILRNRLTDEPYQFAKGCKKVNELKHYYSPEYWEKDIGYQVIDVSSTTIEYLDEYISETIYNPFISERLLQNLSEKNIADKVVPSKDDVLDNKYIFLSKNFTPITAKGWGDILKKIYQKVGIPIDKDTKKHNLSHRFRHGFAMYKVYVENYDALRLAKALRHSGTSTVMTYFNPTKEDKIKMMLEAEELLKAGGIE